MIRVWIPVAWSLAVALSLVAAPSAWAVTSTTVIVTDAGQPVPSGSVRLFDTATGAEVRQEDDDDDATALFLLPGGAYRLEVDGKVVNEFTVTGEGSQTVTAEIPGTTVTGGPMLFGPNGPALHVGLEGSLLWRGGDDFVGGPGGDADNFAQPDSGFGGRAYAGLDFGTYLVRGTVNGAWTNDDYQGSGGSFDIEQDADLDVFWATVDIFYQLAYGLAPGGLYPATLFGIGLGIEYADLEHSFTERVTDPMGVPFAELRQETTGWGIGPRVAGFGKQAIPGTNFWVVGEAGAGLLYGSKDVQIRDDIFGSVFEEGDEESEQILHLTARLAIAYDILYGSTPLTFYADLQYDRFSDSFNQHFLPGREPGSTALYGPFAGFGAKF